MKITLIGLVLIGAYFLSDAQFVKVHGKLWVDSTQLKDRNGLPIVLRGMSFGWHNFWPQYYNSEVVHWLVKDWKCNVLRAAMGVEPNGGYIKDPKGSRQKINEVVDAAIREGIYVVIDWHSHNINLKEAKQFFAETAKQYFTYPNIIYEIFNEPDQETWKEVKSYAEQIIATIRAIDSDNIILIGNPHWDQDVNLPADDPILGYKNLMYTLHFYAASHKKSLRDKGEYALAKGLPLFISESAGMQASGNGKIDETEWNTWINWAEQHKISWITWSVSDKDESCSVLKEHASANGHWKMKDLKESGRKIRNYLRFFNKK